MKNTNVAKVSSSPSLRPSTFSSFSELIGKSYGPSQPGYKISGRACLHSFFKLLGGISSAGGEVDKQRHLSLEAVRMGWNDTRIQNLVTTGDTLSEISRLKDDRCLNSIIDNGYRFVPNMIDPKFITLRVWNEGVKKDISAQSRSCGIDDYVFIQIQIVRLVLGINDENKHPGLKIKNMGDYAFKGASVELGALEKILRKTVQEFDKWITFKAKNNEEMIKKYAIFRKIRS